MRGWDRSTVKHLVWSQCFRMQVRQEKIVQASCILPFSILLCIFCLRSAGAAGAVPSQLFNKTINASYTVNVTARTPDGRVINAPKSVKRTIYISSLGRIFSRRAGAYVRGGSESIDKEPAEAALRYENGALIGGRSAISGAFQLTITFDPGFQNCNVNILAGRENGKPIKWKGLDGVTYESQGPMTISGQSCSINSGNAFAGE